MSKNFQILHHTKLKNYIFHKIASNVHISLWALFHWFKALPKIIQEFLLIVYLIFHSIFHHYPFLQKYKFPLILSINIYNINWKKKNYYMLDHYMHLKLWWLVITRFIQLNIFPIRIKHCTCWMKGSFNLLSPIKSLLPCKSFYKKNISIH